MRHPEVFLIPLLLLLDYVLTVGGSKMAARKYSQHFKFEHYERGCYESQSVEP